MGTLKGFPNPPAMVRAEQSSAAPHAFVMGILKGFRSALGTCHPPCHPFASPSGDFGTYTFPTTPARCARALALGLAKPSRDGSRPAKLGYARPTDEWVENQMYVAADRPTPRWSAGQQAAGRGRGRSPRGGQVGRWVPRARRRRRDPMGTLGGFPNPPALWLRRAKPGYANAISRPHHKRQHSH